MSKVTNSVRKRAVNRKQAKRAKINKLRTKYKDATGAAKTKILEKALRINLNLTPAQFTDK